MCVPPSGDGGNNSVYPLHHRQPSAECTTRIYPPPDSVSYVVQCVVAATGGHVKICNALVCT